MRLRDLQHRLDRPYAVALSRLASAGVGLISAWILARTLGPSGRGEASAALAVMAILPIAAGFGIPLAIRRRSAQGTPPAASVRAVRIVAGLLVVPCSLIAWGCTETFLAPIDSAARLSFQIAASLSPIGFLWLCDVNILIAQERHGAFAFTNFFQIFAYVTFIAFGAALGWMTVAFAIVASFASHFVTLCLTSILISVGLRGERSSVLAIMREGAQYSGSQIAEAFSYRIHQALALPITGSAQAGLYAVAATVASLPYALGQAMATATFTSIVRAETAAEQRERVATAIRGALLLAAIATTIFALLAPLAVPLVFGNRFAGAVVPTVVALVGSIGVVGGYISSSALTALGRGWYMTLAQTIGLLSGALCAIPFGHWWGASGISSAASAGFWLCAIVSIISTRLTVRELLPRRTDLRSAIDLLFRRGPRQLGAPLSSNDS